MIKKATRARDQDVGILSRERVPRKGSSLRFPHYTLQTSSLTLMEGLLKNTPRHRFGEGLGLSTLDEKVTKEEIS